MWNGNGTDRSPVNTERWQFISVVILFVNTNLTWELFIHIVDISSQLLTDFLILTSLDTLLFKRMDDAVSFLGVLGISEILDFNFLFVHLFFLLLDLNFVSCGDLFDLWTCRFPIQIGSDNLAAPGFGNKCLCRVAVIVFIFGTTYCRHFCLRQ